MSTSAPAVNPALMNAFAGIGAASSTQKLPPFNPGVYVVAVKALKYIPNSRKGPLSIAEFTILEATGEGANQVGTSASQVIKMSLDSAMGNVKNLVAAVTGQTEAEVTTQDAAEAFSEGNPCAGIKVKLEAYYTKKKDGSNFTLHSYKPVEVSGGIPAAGTKPAGKGKQ